MQSFDQGALGHLTQKNTSFWTNLGVNLHGIRTYGKFNKYKDLKAEWLARWAPGFRESIITSIRDLLPRMMAAKFSDIPTEWIRRDDKKALYKRIPGGETEICTHFLDDAGCVKYIRPLETRKHFVTLPNSHVHLWNSIRYIETYDKAGRGTSPAGQRRKGKLSRQGGGPSRVP